MICKFGGMKMSRKIAREVAMKLLYERQFLGKEQKESIDILEQEFELIDSDKKYLYDVLAGTENYEKEIDEIISKYAKGWTINRIAKVDLSILRLSLYEIMYRDDIPPGVSINEAVELAKKYGNEKSGSFINGILGSFIRDRGKDVEGEPEKV